VSRLRDIAERVYRKENPGSGPYGARPQLSDLWPADQEAYVRRVERILDEQLQQAIADGRSREQYRLDGSASWQS
jgi:hypothetical protein